MSDRHEPDEVSDPHRFPDGRPKASPDDTSLLGLAAVWSEIDAPMPPKRISTRGGGSHQRSRSRRARRGRRPPTLLVVGIGMAVMLTLGVIALVAILL